MSTLVLEPQSLAGLGSLAVTPFLHPQGCRSYLLHDPGTHQAVAIDPHLDLVEDMAATVTRERLRLILVVDTHTHADHPSGSAALAARFSARRAAHPAARHAGVADPLADGRVLEVGGSRLLVRHAPGHTPDHLVLLADRMLFAGDTLLIGGVARTDFLGGDAGTLFDTLHALLKALPDDTVVYPGHDYEGRVSSTIADEKASNPWLRIADRDAFVKALTANPPPRPANMDDLLRLNREGVDIPPRVTAARAADVARAGGASSIVDVRTALELQSGSVPGSRHVPLDQVAKRADEIRATAAPRLLLCRTGSRAEAARRELEKAGVRGLQVIEGGAEAWVAAGGPWRHGKAVMSLERQVRIVAGILIVTGTLLALVHPAFLVLPAFVGTGLAFSGITDWCGMGLLLARMPWNTRAAVEDGSPVGGTCSAGLPPGAEGGTCSAGLPPGETVGGTCSAGPPPSEPTGAACSLPARRIPPGD